jgi:Asp-tRNA(Asn)/Glu-tRNA(Gln) amidotransferase A subunit family amidase
MNQALEDRGATESLAAIRRGELEAEAMLQHCRARVLEREDTVGAWQCLDWDNAQRQLEAVMSRPAAGSLRGLPVAVKDIFDTHDLPTGYGSAIYGNHRPVWDAACVARLRAAGAIIPGKTVTSEFAFGRAGVTRNPLDASRSPGASSSGSAAAVAAGMVSVAVASQTGASTIRPSAYCGIVGFKPTFGLISVAGLKALSNTMDTVGVMARTIEDVALLTGVMAGLDEAMRVDTPDTPPRLRLWTGGELEQASASMTHCLERALLRAVDHGASIGRGPLPQGFADLATAQEQLVAYEARRELADECLRHGEEFSDMLLGFMQAGEALSPARAGHWYMLRRDCLTRLDALFGDATALVMPSATDVAPRFECGSGDPLMSRAWTLLGLPAITIPCGHNQDGLPLGLQLAARPGHDAALLGVAKWFAQCLEEA